MQTKMIMLVTLTIALSSCSKATQYYNIKDFNKINKIDAHIHLRSNQHDFMEQAKPDNFKAITILVDHGIGSISPQYDFAIHQVNQYPNDIKFVCTFAMDGWDENDWLDKTVKSIDAQITAGAVAVKVWKNIGMEFRDKNGNLVMIDDPKFDPLFKYLAERGIPVTGHLGEPKNCWLPLEEMTTNNDRDYFTNNSQYHMYLHPEFPSYEEQITARDHMLDKNPDLIFIGAHLGSLEWNLDELAKTLEKFPNMAVDMAERMGQLFDQTSHDRERVRNFFIKYQDRLLYATDLIDRGEANSADFKQNLHDMWFFDWQYFVSDEIMKSHLINSDFQGLKLPAEVIDKIYFENAEKWYSVFN